MLGLPACLVVLSGRTHTAHMYPKNAVLDTAPGNQRLLISESNSVQGCSGGYAWCMWGGQVWRPTAAAAASLHES